MRRVQLNSILLKKIVTIFREGENKEVFANSFQPLFVKTAIEKGQILYEWDKDTIKALLVWKIRKMKPQKNAVLSFGSGDCQIDYLVVADAYKRQGLGRKLMKHLESIAVTEGAQRLVLDVHQTNKRAITFYEELGYVRLREAFNKGVPLYEYIKPIKQPKKGMF